jgi:hypothetical protein
MFVSPEVKSRILVEPSETVTSPVVFLSPTPPVGWAASARPSF